MKLWILTLTKNGWKKFARDYCEALVIVRAQTEDVARNLAVIGSNLPVWNDRNLSECKELTQEGDEGIVIEVMEPTE